MKAILWTGSARRAFRALPAKVRSRIETELAWYAETGAGDVRVFSPGAGRRMRVADHRVIFIETEQRVEVRAAGHRRAIYRRKGQAMADPQFIRTESGEELVVLTRRDYEALMARIGDEGGEDVSSARIVSESDAALGRAVDVLLPDAVWSDIAAGKNPARVLRKLRGMTQEELAAAAGLSQSYLSDIEAGRKRGSADTLKALARALAVPLDLLA